MRWKVRMLIACGWIAASWPARPDPVLHAPEAAVKAAMVFNVLAFVKWPDTRFGITDPLLLCVLGDDATDQSLLRLDGSLTQGRRLKVERLPTSRQEQQRCQAIFISNANSSVLYRVAAATHGLPTLLLGEGATALENGAMIALTLSADRYVLDVNMPAVLAAELVVSSKLLRLARRVIN